MVNRDNLLAAAQKLHTHLALHLIDGALLHGPDAGIRFNLRAWRFLKSAFDFITWRDDYVFMQTQGYWVLSNWKLYDATGEARYRELAINATGAILRLQHPEGFWPYPLPQRRHLIATLEGDWASVALLSSYSRELRCEWLDAAIRWYDFVVHRIGFQPHSCGEAINYFDKPRGKVPNNSVISAWFFLRLWEATGDERFLEHVGSLLEFIASVQLPSGELPYIVDGPFERGRPHYLCFQYNSFQFLELERISRLAPGAAAQAVPPRLAEFLARGVSPSGACARDCFHVAPELDYHTAVLAAAMCVAARHGWVPSADLYERPYTRVLSRQRLDGSFVYSEGDYGLLRDARSYPRPMAMTLYHLLLGADCSGGYQPAS